MGFGFKSAFLGLASSKKHRQSIPNNSGKSNDLSVNDVISSSPKSAIRRSTDSIKAPTSSRSSSKQAIKGTTKSVRFDCSCNRSVKVSPSDTVIPRPSTDSAPRGTNASAAMETLMRQSTSDDRSTISTSTTTRVGREWHSSSPVPSSTSSGLGEVRVGSSTSHIKTKPGIASSDKQARLLSPRGLHSRNLSYGTIYNASKSKPPKEDTRKQATVSNALVRVHDQANNARAAIAASGDPKLVKATGHVFGLGGCDYGHGSIINGTVKTLKSLARDAEASCSKINDAVSEGSCLPFLNVRMADELKNAGNEEYKKGMYSSAVTLYDKAISLHPRSAVCHNNKAVALAALGKLRDAIEECLEAITCEPSYSRAHFRVGTLYTRLGHLDDARKHFKLSGLDNSSESLQSLLVIEGHLNNMKRAMKAEDWRRVLDESTLVVEAGADACNLAIAANAEALLKLHRPNEALENLEAAKKMEKRARKDCSRLLLIETQVYFYLGRFEEAVNAAEQAAKLEFDKECLVWLRKAWGAADAHRAGNEYYRVGKYTEACAMYSQGLYHLPANGVLLCNRAACRSRLGQWASTIEDCNAALKSNPEYSEALQQRAYAHSRLGHWEEAHRDYLELSKMRPGDPAILTSLREMQEEIRRVYFQDGEFFSAYFQTVMKKSNSAPLLCEE